MATTYPDWRAGQRVTAAQLLAAQPLHVVRGSDSAGRVNNTLANDDVLTLAVEANAVYNLHAWLGFTALAAADFRAGWSVPAGSTLQWTPYTQNGGAASTVGGVITDRSSAATAQTSGGIGAGNIMTMLIFGTLRIGATAGSIILQWAQDTTNATGTVLKADSSLTLKRTA
jgi:cytochrome b